MQWQPAAPFVLDVAEFEQALTEAAQAEQAGDRIQLVTRLTQAIDLYTGDLLPGCYDDWILPERERLREQFLSAVEHLSALLEQQRAYAAAIHAANRLLRADPLHEASEGNPLFVVEMIRTGDWHAPDPRPATDFSASGLSRPALPAKVQAVIQARLAQLSPPAHTLVCVAATLRRAFTYAVLAQTSGSDEEGLVQGLDELWQRRILREQGSHAYDFSHDRIREVAYHAISPARRRQLHQRVAQTLEHLHTQDSSAVNAQLAFHYERAGLVDKAASYYYQAGERARQLYASQEAIAYLQRRLVLLKLTPESADAQDLELALQMALGAVWIPIKGYSSPEVTQAYDRATALCRQLAATPQLFSALWGVHEVYLFRAEREKALMPSEQCLHIAEQTADVVLLIEAYHALWGTHFYLGSLTTALAYARQGIALYAGQQHQALALDYGAHDTGVCALQLAGMSLWLLGYPAQAEQTYADLIALTRELAQPIALADAFLQIAIFYQCESQPEPTLAYAEAAIQLCNEHGYLAYRAPALVLQGWAIAQHGAVQTGLELMQQGLADWQAAGHTLVQIYFHVLLAEGYTLAGRIDEGLATLAAGQAVAQRCDDLFYRAELYRRQGELLLAQGAAPNVVEQAYQQALATAGQRNEKILELRALVSLARLWQRQGNSNQARQRLAALYSWFSEGFATADLQAASTLLAALA